MGESMGWEMKYLYLLCFFGLIGCANAVKPVKPYKYVLKVKYKSKYGGRELLFKCELQNNYKSHQTLFNTEQECEERKLRREKSQADQIKIVKNKDNRKKLEIANRKRIAKEKSIAYWKNKTRSINEYIDQNPKYKKFHQLAIDGKVAIGMPERLFNLSRGYCTKNVTTGRTYEHVQYVCDNKYVYTQNGFVTTIQSK